MPLPPCTHSRRPLKSAKLRALPGFAAISVGDLYTNPTIEKLARLARLDPPAVTPAPAERAASPAPSPAPARYLACTVLQALGVLCVSGIYAWQWLGAYLSYGYFAVTERTILEALALSLAIYGITTPVVLCLSIVLKWLLLGRVRPGRYPLWSFYYLRFWFVRAVMRAAPVRYLSGTPFLAMYYRLMGARIGKNVVLPLANPSGDPASKSIEVAVACMLWLDNTGVKKEVEGNESMKEFCTTVVKAAPELAQYAIRSKIAEVSQNLAKASQSP